MNPSTTLDPQMAPVQDPPPPGVVPAGSVPVQDAPLEAVTLDLYRDIHKGIRAELLGVTVQAGSVDPADDDAVEAVVGRIQAVAALLDSHAEHEDEHIQPVLEAHRPDLAEVIALEHPRIEHRVAAMVALAERIAAGRDRDRRLAVHRLYLATADFAGDYLLHQTFEEARVMPALAEVLPVEDLAAVEQAIVGSIPPGEMATSLRVMLPAMNVDDRADLLGGMRMGAPAEVFAGVWSLAADVLTDGDHRRLAARLGIES